MSRLRRTCRLSDQTPTETGSTPLFKGRRWREGGDAAIGKLMQGRIAKMPVPFMGPPLLLDKKADVAIAQMPAIVLYLGETLKLLPASPALRALTMKIVCDTLCRVSKNG